MVDALLALVLLLAAVAGWQRGLLGTALGLVGLVVGVLLGLWLAPQVLDWAGLPDLSPLARLGIQLLVLTITVAVVTAGCAALARTALRAVDSDSVRSTDAFLGAVGSVLVTGLVLWLCAGAVRPALPPSWADALAGSRVLSALDSTMPPVARDLPGRFQDALQASGFPEAFGGLTDEPAVEADPPTGAGAGTVAVRQASDSILKIRSSSAACGPVLSVGSGWTVAPERVVTNAHVVAGGEDITVQVEGAGRQLDARVVAFDPSLDLAILAVPGLRAEPLPRAGELPAGSEAAVAGFPGGGAYTLTPARVEAPVQARGQNIYGSGEAVRQIYPMRADIRQGDSGGPLLTPDGEVAGTVFAKSLDHDEVGYALTDDATADLLDGAGTLGSRVATGACRAH